MLLKLSIVLGISASLSPIWLPSCCTHRALSPFPGALGDPGGRTTKMSIHGLPAVGKTCSQVHLRQRSIIINISRSSITIYQSKTLVGQEMQK